MSEIFPEAIRNLPQAMLCGKSAVSFDIDGAREVVNENTGRLLEPKNVEQLIKTSAELIADKKSTAVFYGYDL